MRPVRATALYIARSFKAFALTGRQVTAQNNPGRCPGLRAFALSGRAACIGFCLFRACCLHWLLPFQGVLLALASAFSGCAASKSFCPLLLLYPSAGEFQLRYVPVTVGSGCIVCIPQGCCPLTSRTTEGSDNFP